MPEKVSVWEELQVIQVDSYGDVTSADLMASMAEVLRIREERGISKVFVDATGETSLPPTTPVFEFGSELANAFRGVKFAVVTSPQTEHDLRFLETVTRNRGAKVRMFVSREDALEWLLEKSSRND